MAREGKRGRQGGRWQAGRRLDLHLKSGGCFWFLLRCGSWWWVTEGKISGAIRPTPRGSLLAINQLAIV
jgi:hypothetical protein